MKEPKGDVFVYTRDYEFEEPDLFELMEEIDKGQYTESLPNAERMVDTEKLEHPANYRIFKITFEEIKQ